MSMVYAAIAVGTAATGSAYMQIQAGEIQNIEAKTAAKAEEGAAVSREADRMARLNEALASQNAAAGAGGVMSFEGSPLTVMQEDTRRAEEDTLRDEGMTKIRAMTIRSRGRMAKRQARTGAYLGLLGNVGQVFLSAGGNGDKGGGE